MPNKRKILLQKIKNNKCKHILKILDRSLSPPLPTSFFFKKLNLLVPFLCSFLIDLDMKENCFSLVSLTLKTYSLPPPTALLPYPCTPVLVPQHSSTSQLPWRSALSSSADLTPVGKKKKIWVNIKCKESAICCLMIISLVCFTFLCLKLTYCLPNPHRVWNSGHKQRLWPNL